jgi:stringent starvation protein B
MAPARTSKQRPYLLRAMHEWMVDNSLTAHIVVDAAAEGIRVPEGHVKDGRIVLNVSYAATRNLALGNEHVSFEARFGGVPCDVIVPVDAVLGIYARETGQGMVFAEEGGPESPPPDSDDASKTGTDRPKLKLVT